MTVYDSEFFRFPDFDLGEVLDLPEVRRVRDALVARLDGYRPLTIDIDVPVSHGPVPVVLWIHGGAWLWGSNKLNDGPVPSMAIKEQVLQAGYAFAAITYRLAAEAPWPAQLHDAKAAVRWLRHYADTLGLDASRVACWGESAGAHIASMLGATNGVAEAEGSVGCTSEDSSVVACVDWYGPSDLNLTYSEDGPEAVLLGGDPSRATQASPRYTVTANSAPMFIVHGQRDSIVPVEQSELMAEACAKSGVPAELTIVEGAGHALTFVEARDYIAPSVDFLRRVFELAPGQALDDSCA